MKKTAVITDATSPGFFFPRWRRYYGRLFGLKNLHVLTYADMKEAFSGLGIGNIWEVASVYNDQLRAQVMSDLVACLLNTYDTVLRCDVDEFLVPDTDLYLDLAAYVAQNEMPYVTGHGVDVIETLEDPPFDTDAPVLVSQRRYGLRSAALNKTSLTKTKLRWAPGFHSANVFPRFGGLYIFHLKYADVRRRVDWHDEMLKGLNSGTSEHAYFGEGAANLLGLQRFHAGKPKSGSETRETFDQRFLDSVTYNPVHQIYQGQFISQDFLFEIPSKFNDAV